MLTAKKIARLGVGRYLDGHGLYLQITAKKKNGKIMPTVGGGSWLLRYERGVKISRKTGKPIPGEHWIGLGSLATFTLKEARERARAKRQLLADGIDPLDKKREQKAAKAVAVAKTITFEKAASQWFEEKQSSWRSPKHRDQVINTLEDYAFPVIGSLPIDAIDKTLVMKVLEQPYEGQRLWDAVPETASRIRGRIEKVLGWAAVRGYRSGENPARWKDFLENALTARAKIPEKKIKHHAALSYNDIGEFFTKLRKRNCIEAVALEFTILTAARSNEVIGAKWKEFELRKVPVTALDEEGNESTVPGPCWIVPADRMKGFKRHRIPLSYRAVEILKAVSRNQEATLVFGGLSDMDMWLLLTKTMGYSVTVHGFRSTFRNWAGNVSHHPPEAAEKAIAHSVKDKTEASYWREDMYQKRIPLMADWARFCELPKAAGNVTQIRRKAGV
jgi:integrase